MIRLGTSDILRPSVRATISRWLRMVMFLISIVAIGTIVVDYGFVLDETEVAVVRHIYDYTWWVYFASYLFRLVFDWSSINRKTIFMTVILGLLLML